MGDDITYQSLKDKFEVFRDNLLTSKKYWIIYFSLILIFALSRFEIVNYQHPKMEIIAFILLTLMGIFCISYFKGHNKDKELYKTAFVIILIFGLICSFVTPICFAPDEVEHFVRTEITSRGDLFPDYVNGSFQTIQSTMDLISVGRMNHNNYDEMNRSKSTIFHTNADTMPINHTLIDYPSAFMQNPFWGYLFPAIGMLIAKLLNLNSIWLLWMGRIFNVLLYSSLVSIAIKKTPILKMQMLVLSCLPLAVFSASSLSIDSFINGMGILTVAYFFYLYKLPEKSISYKHIIKYSILVGLIGTCKITCFALIFLLIFIPKDNFKSDNEYLYGFLSIIFIAIFALFWSKYYANPGYLNSHRATKWAVSNINSTQQMDFVLSHKKQTLMEILKLPNHIKDDLLFRWGVFNPIYLMFLGAVSFLYPVERFNLKTKIGALLTIIIMYVGTYMVSLLTWTPVGQLNPIMGVQQRYFIPILPLIPFVFGFNHEKMDKSKLNMYIIMMVITFITFMLLYEIMLAY